MAESLSVDRIQFVNYQSEAQMPDIIELIKQDLSEPYSIYTYRYFINNWSKLCFLAYDENECVGAIVCKIEPRDKVDQHVYRRHMSQYIDRAERGAEPEESQQIFFQGYIAMLAVKQEYRKLKIGSKLVLMAVKAMKEAKADEVVLETEVVNEPALRLYENLGFLRDKRLFRYYLNGLDAYRLKLWMI